MNTIDAFPLSRRFRLKSLGFAGLFVVMSGAAQAQQTPWASAAPTETVLYNFGVKSGDGKLAFPTLITDTSGALYGTTYIGGAFDAGTVFRLSPPAKGKTQWTETVLYSFGGSPSDGVSPSHQGALVFGNQGELYGTTSLGGSHNLGAVFQLSPPAPGSTQWTETILYSFGSTTNDGTNPETGVILDEYGRLYGTTPRGASNSGTVFRLTPKPNGSTPWTKTLLYRFQNFADGVTPNNVIFDGQGGLYGTTAFGGTGVAGTAFRLSPPATGQSPWTKTALFNFNGLGGPPGATLLLDTRGALYGSQDAGIVYKLTPPSTNGQAPWTKTDLFHNNQPTFLLMDRLGALYGAGGSPDINSGPLAGGFAFKLTPPLSGQTQWTSTILHTFGSVGDGSYPRGGLVFGRNGALYGATPNGGTTGRNGPLSGYGTIYQLQLPVSP